MDDLHGTGPRLALDLAQANLSQKIRFRIWTVNEVGVRCEHLKRERVLHNDRTEIVSDAKYIEGSVAQHGADKVAKQRQRRVQLDPSSRRLTMMLTKTCKSADSIVGLLGACRTCQLIAVTCNSRRTVVQKIEATDKSIMDTTETISLVLGAVNQSARVALMKPGADYDPNDAFL